MSKWFLIVKSDTKLILRLFQVFDYDQLLDKKPGADDAIFAWHQDMAYWPNPTMTPDTRTVTFSLAFDSTTIENGCIRYIPGSGKSKLLRNHKPVASNREEGHAIAVAVGDDEEVKYAEVIDLLTSNIHSRFD